MREFLSWAGSRTQEHSVGNGTKRVRKAKPSTAWPYYRTLRRLFNWAVEEGYTVDELKRLLAVCDLDIRTGARSTGVRNKGMLLLFIDSGVRRAELTNLKLSDLELESRRVRVLGKGKASNALISPDFDCFGIEIA